MALHFTRRLIVPLEPSSKARAFTILRKNSNDKFDILVAFHGNSIAKYSITAKKDTGGDEEEEKEGEKFSLKQTFG